ncbi:hypothetical protein [Coleofasciculus sp. FACHB-SPT36]|uniref:hypothetical protein n=1 Tax=Cyanophyceae TaxID=3028117 RepID=UPI00168B12C2|nr:hypothetical protein [Coleofasciculus sp. FACHB-SPT36]
MVQLDYTLIANQEAVYGLTPCQNKRIQLEAAGSKSEYPKVGVERDGILHYAPAPRATTTPVMQLCCCLSRRVSFILGT